MKEHWVKGRDKKSTGRATDVAVGTLELTRAYDDSGGA